MKQKQYPPQTGSYFVKVKSGQSTDNWRDFNLARLQISVGQDYHEGDKFKALAAWCQSRFEKIHICVNDTLQRFNIMFEEDMTEPAAHKSASRLGQEWIKRNGVVIGGLPQALIKRWNEWKALPDYPKTLLQAEWLYTNNPEFQQAINRNIMEIWERRGKLGQGEYDADSFNGFFKLSKAYLLEEITVFSLMFESDTGIDIYPGTTLFAATLFQGREIANAPSGLGKGHFCRVDFSRNKNVKEEGPGVFGT